MDDPALEEWREHPDAPGCYVSSFGRVAGILKGSLSRGHWRYSLMRDGKTHYRFRDGLLRDLRGLPADAWVDLPDFPRYQVSGAGDVRRFFGAHPNGNGYLYAKFAQVRRGIHILVCETFHGPKPFPSAEAAHWDGDRSNNRATNLRWASRLENEADKVRHGTGDVRGFKNPMAKLTDEQVIELRRRKAAGETAKDLAAEYGVHPVTVQMIAAGRKRRFVVDLVEDRACSDSVRASPILSPN